ncbi:MAG: class I SAM-dependent methyltransferase [bacterium]
MPHSTASTPSHQSVSAYDDAARVAEYDAKMEIMHPNRAKMADIVCAMLPFARDAEITVLDLGTGTGFLVARLLQAFPQAQVIAVDGASAMMQQAQARLGAKSKQLTWKIGSFQQLAGDNDVPELDAVVSSFALHHLAAEEKRRLYHALHAKLRDGAWFVNADILVAPYEEIEACYQHLRQVGIQKRWREHGEEKSLAAIAAELVELEKKDRDQPLPLDTDLRLLKEAGFRAVDCFWKETREAVWGGLK